MPTPYGGRPPPTAVHPAPRGRHRSVAGRERGWGDIGRVAGWKRPARPSRGVINTNTPHLLDGPTPYRHMVWWVVGPNLRGYGTTILRSECVAERGFGLPARPGP